MTIRATIYFTATNGSMAEITGDGKALDAIEQIFERVGIKYNETVETWDEGYYIDPAMNRDD